MCCLGKSGVAVPTPSLAGSWQCVAQRGRRAKADGSPSFADRLAAALRLSRKTVPVS